MEKDEAIKQFGFPPSTIGERPRGWWIVDTIEEEEKSGNAKIGDLCVKTRDAGVDFFDPNAARKPNYCGSSTDEFDSTYRYYYFSPLKLIESQPRKVTP